MLFERHLENVPVKHFDIAAARKRSGVLGRECIIELDEQKAAHRAGQVPRQRTAAGSDLHDLVFRSRPERADDLPLKVLIDQEVLAE
jgi:hypothetical protein